MSIPLWMVSKEIKKLSRDIEVMASTCGSLQMRLQSANANSEQLFYELVKRFTTKALAAILMEEISILDNGFSYFVELTFDFESSKTDLILSFSHYNSFTDELNDFELRSFPISWIDMETDSFSVSDIDFSYFDEDYKDFVSYLQDVLRRNTPKNKSIPKRATFPPKIQIAYKEKQVQSFRNFEDC